MKERPILFSGDMVRSILDGRKTQTRRPVKPHHLRGSEEPGQVLNILGRGLLKEASLLCPLGQPGDRLWVRETWTKTQYEKPVYRADSRDRDGWVWPSVASDPNGVLWKPSIHMPRWASRITLEIVRVSIERVQDITEEGAIKEGCVPLDSSRPREMFGDLWQSIYGTWDANPWVWAVEFRRMKP
jgi:hypothetical protein